MAVTVSAALVGAAVPRVVQVTVGGLTPGEPYTVTRSGGGEVDATIRGGSGVASGSQAVLGDALAPINTPVTYQVQHAGEVVTSAPVTVSTDAQVVVSRLDGTGAVLIPGWGHRDNADPRSHLHDLDIFDVPGRVDAPFRHGPSSLPQGVLQVTTTGATTVGMERLIRDGVPVAIRTSGSIRDIRAVRLAVFTSDDSALTGLVDARGVHREWVLPFREVGVPSGGGPVAVASWDDFDAFWATPGPTRTNRNTNPSFETNVTGYDPPANATVTRGTVAGFAVMGSAYMNIAATGADVAAVTRSLSADPGDVGRFLGFGLSLRRVSGPTHARLQIAGPGTAAPVVTPWTAIPTTGHLRLVVGNEIASAAQQITTQVQLAGGSAGGTPTAGDVRVDAWHLETGATLAEAQLRARHPWDGTTSGAAWTGTAHASTSTRTARWWVDFDAMWLGGQWVDLDRSDWVA